MQQRQSIFKKQITLKEDSDEEEIFKPDEYEQTDVLKEFTFQQTYQDNQEKKQAFYISLLDEIQETEFLNEEYLQEYSLKGERYQYNQNTIQYDFPLSYMHSFYTPELNDIFDIKPDPKIDNAFKETQLQEKQLGQPIAITLSENSIAIGLSKPSSLLIWNDFHFEGSKKNEIIIHFEEKLGELVCIDFYFDNMILACGFKTGMIAFVDSNKGSFIQSFNDIHSNSLVCLKFVFRVEEQQLVTLSTDVEGTACLTNFQKGIFSYEISQKPLIRQMNYPGNTVQILRPELMEKYIKYSNQEYSIRLGAVMNQEKIWICLFRIYKEGTPDALILYHFESPFKMFKSQVFNNCCCFGEGYLKSQAESRELKQQLILVGCWQTQFQISKFIDFNSRVLNLSFLAQSLCILITKKAGIFLINTVNLFPTEDNRKYSDFRFLKFPKSQFNYIGQEVCIPGFQITKARKKFREAVLKLIKNKARFEQEEDEEQEGDPIMYNQAFTTNSELLVVMNKKGIRIAKIAGWQKFLKLFYATGEWLYGMHYLVSLYRGSNRVYTNFLNLKYEERKKQLLESIQDISAKYHNMIMECINQNFDEIQDYDKIEENDRRYTEQFINYDEQIELKKKANQTLFCILIEFLVECGCDEILFEEYMPKTLQILNDDNKFFLECLGPFFNAKKVKYIPEDKLNEILNYQLKNQDYEQLQRMIASLDHTRVETTELIKTSLKQGLLISLSIICSQGDAEEFLTPIVKVWSFILVLIDKQEYEQASYFMVRALTFIKMAMQRKTIQGDRIDEYKLSEIIKGLSHWFFQEDNLEKMLTLHTVSTFEIILLFFTRDIQPILNQAKLSKNKNYNVDWIQNDCQTNAEKAISLIDLVITRMIKNDEEKDSEFQRTFRSKSTAMLEDLLKKTYPYKEVELHYQLFIIRIYSNNYLQVKNLKVLSALSYVLQNLTALDQLTLFELIGNMNFNRREEIKNHPKEKDVMEYLKSEYLVNVLKKIDNDDDKSQEDEQTMIDLQFYAELTTLVTVTIFLAEKKKEYKRACEFQLFTNNLLVKNKIFNWLWKTMEMLEELTDSYHKNQLELLKDLIVAKLTDLIKINSEKTRELIARFHKDAENLVIHKLDAYPEMQLEYVENVIKKEREAGKKIETELLVLQMSLYCQLNPDLIIPEMEKYEYPLDNILLVCRQYKIDHAIAYVLVRLGSIQEAVQIYVEIFKEKVKTIIKEVQYAHDLQVKVGNINQKSVFSNLFGLNKQDSNKVNGYLIAKDIAEQQFDQEVKKIINICVQNNKFDSSDEIWYILLDNILYLKDKVIEDREGQSFLKDTCVLAVCTIIATIAKNSNLEILLMQLQNRYDNLDMGQLKLTFQEIISNYIYVENVLTNSRSLIQEDLVIKIEGLIDLLKKGMISKGKCWECRIELNLKGQYENEQQSDDIVSFQCGHSYHRGCVVEQQSIFLCQVCCQRNEQYAYDLLLLNSKIKLDKLTQNLKEKKVQTFDDDDFENQQEKQEKKEEQKVNQELNDLMHQDMNFKPTVSKNTEMKRTRRTNKLKYFDRVRNETVQIIEDSNTEIVSFFKRHKDEKKITKKSRQK